jgi:hypothetical protein
MQLKKQIRKANFRALLASGEPYCKTCHRRVKMAACRNKKCPDVRAEKSRLK